MMELRGVEKFQDLVLSPDADMKDDVRRRWILILSVYTCLSLGSQVALGGSVLVFLGNTDSFHINIQDYWRSRLLIRWDGRGSSARSRRSSLAFHVRRHPRFYSNRWSRRTLRERVWDDVRYELLTMTVRIPLRTCGGRDPSTC